MDHVTLSSALYFTAATCRAALAAHRAQLAWLPPADDGDAIATASDPIGGC